MEDKKRALYGVISQNGHIYTLHYHGRKSMKSSSQHYSKLVFENCPPEIPVIDFRTANVNDIIEEVTKKSMGCIEEQPQPYNPGGFLTGAMFTPVPLSTLLQYAQNAGATITTVGEIMNETNLEK